jgi:methionine synthase II (cobalamin-independent)
VPSTTRFQASLPSVRVVVLRRTMPEAVPLVMPAYARAMRAEIARMAAAIPHAELAIQWDCTEPAQYEGMPADQRTALNKMLIEYASYVPDDIELGYHLCYGDFEHRHSVQPPSLAVCVEITNTIAAAVHRPIGWVHMPVPRDRHDDAYFTPLRDLTMHPETQLYLGLVHHTDGVAGTRQRMEAASRYVKNFGIATECGWGRRPKTTLPELIRIHAAAADLP